MKHTFAIALLILAGCAAPQKPPSFVLQPGTKIIMRGHDDAFEARKVFRSQTDFWRTGSVVELGEALELTTIKEKAK